jgi:1-acyl-sn-glycerol-3-phosphate acyltransferase
VSHSKDFPLPHPVQFRGHPLARWLLRRMGWRVHFEGLPGLQGVLAVYPHTSNWDFIYMLIVKWAIGIPVRFWGKDSLFRFPVFGRWMRYLGGVPVERTSARGMVGNTVARMQQARRQGEYFWLALSPEGTRKRIPGWRSGLYRTAVLAGVPLGVVGVNYRDREVKALDFLRLSGDEAVDFARIASALEGAVGRIPANAAPIRLLDASLSREDTIVK